MPHITRPSYTRTNNQTAGWGRGGASEVENKTVVQPSAYQSCTQSARRRLISLLFSCQLSSLVTAVAPDVTV